MRGAGIVLPGAFIMALLVKGFHIALRTALRNSQPSLAIVVVRGGADPPFRVGRLPSVLFISAHSFIVCSFG
jgi:hypothetical protein